MRLSLLLAERWEPYFVRGLFTNGFSKERAKKDEAIAFIKTLDLTEDQRIIYERRILAIANHDLFYSIDGKYLMC